MAASEIPPVVTPETPAAGTPPAVTAPTPPAATKAEIDALIEHVDNLGESLRARDAEMARPAPTPAKDPEAPAYIQKMLKSADEEIVAAGEGMLEDWKARQAEITDLRQRTLAAEQRATEAQLAPMISEVQETYGATDEQVERTTDYLIKTQLAGILTFEEGMRRLYPALTPRITAAAPPSNGAEPPATPRRPDQIIGAGAGAGTPPKPWVPARGQSMEDAVSIGFDRVFNGAK